MRRKTLPAASPTVIAAIGSRGILDPDGLASATSGIVGRHFRSRGRFAMLAASGMLLMCVTLAASPRGAIRPGAEFSTPSWIAMLFAAGMGVELLFRAVAEPLTHYRPGSQFMAPPVAARQASLATNFHRGFHALAVYGATALCIAYFSFRPGTPTPVSAPVEHLFPGEPRARVTGRLSDFMAIVAIVIGVGGSIAAAIPRGFRMPAFFPGEVTDRFRDRTPTCMVRWIAWGPFVGVFVARISKGRTIREFIVGVPMAPTLFSVLRFGAFGGIGLYDVPRGTGELLQPTKTDVERVTFAPLERLPLTTPATPVAAFLFIVTPVVSAAFVSGAFSTGGDPNPRRVSA